MGLNDFGESIRGGGANGFQCFGDYFVYTGGLEVAHGINHFRDFLMCKKSSIRVVDVYFVFTGVWN